LKNGFKEKDFFENLGMGQPCPRERFMKRKVLKSWRLKESGEQVLFSKNFSDQVPNRT
jgi:hypothetical protein